jgi:CRISPR system Cascade subunit CasB
MSLKDIIEKVSEQMLRRFGTGDLAELRRMNGPVEPSAYWRLAAECGFLEDDPQRWAPVIRILAMLTPKGERRPSDRLHNPMHRLGAVLADGGDPNWQGGADSRPFLSEARLARFLATPADQRAEALTGVARALASSRDRSAGVDCVEIANLLLASDTTEALQKIAQSYYARLDAARARSEETTQ